MSAASVRYHGLLVRVPDLNVAVKFYGDALGFAHSRLTNEMARLSDPSPFYLEAVSSGPVPARDQARAGAAFFARDIHAAIERLNALGVPLILGRGQKTAGGEVTCFLDPFGNVHTVIQPTPMPEDFSEPRVYNAGLKLPMGSMPTARRIYGDVLGFAIATERFYPPSLPMIHGDGSFAFMIHDKQPWEGDVRARAPLYPHDAGSALVFTVGDVKEFHAWLGVRAATIRLTPVQPFPLGLRMGLIDNSGVPSEVWQLAAGAPAT